MAGGFAPGAYLSATLWATNPADGTRVPASLACRADAWPPATGRPLPAVVQVYGAYGRWVDGAGTGRWGGCGQGTPGWGRAATW